MDLGFKPCHHEPCLYHHPSYKGQQIYFLRQVNDFAISCATKHLAKQIIQRINDKLTIDVKPLGTIPRFNGVDITQTKHFVKISNPTYIDKILQDKHWEPAQTIDAPLPMRDDPEYNRSIENDEPLSDRDLLTTEKEFGLSYRQGIGELLYAMVTCRPDISYPLIKLSQYSAKPAKSHFTAVKGIYEYLRATRSEGIHYWRQNPRDDLPSAPFPKTQHSNNYIPHNREESTPIDLRASVDSDYANDTLHRKSVTGMIMKMAGGAILYKSLFQSTITLSSTEAEFIAACDAAKNILYVRSILNDIGIPQHQASTLFEDNQGALLMATAGQPTKRTRHMDIKYFALQNWIDRDLIALKHIATHDNESDAMTKNLGRTLFYRHIDYIMGKTLPTYVKSTNLQPTDLSILYTPPGYKAREGSVL